MSHRYAAAVPPSRGWILTVVAVSLAVLTLVGVVLLRPTGEDRPDVSALGFAGAVVEAEVAAVEDIPCVGAEPAEEEGLICLRLTYELTEGPDRGRLVTQDFVGAQRFEEGDRVVLAHDPEAAPEFRYRFFDRQRQGALLWLAVAFALAVVLLGRLRGFAALAGLAASLMVLGTFILPSILDGRSPLLVAVVGASAIAFLALYLAHGFTMMTTVAVLGTLSALALTAVLAEVFVGAAQITGFASEEATVIQVGAARIDLAGLVLGGVVIGALGAIDDMTVTQASAVWELRAANPRMSPAALLRSGLRIGRDHVASTVNTLALAYAGASMPLLILFVLSRQSVATVATSEVIATEIVRTLVGSIGLVASVPITTWLAARAVARPAPEDEAPAGRTRVRPD